MEVTKERFTDFQERLPEIVSFEQKEILKKKNQETQAPVGKKIDHLCYQSSKRRKSGAEKNI